MNQLSVMFMNSSKTQFFGGTCPLRSTQLSARVVSQNHPGQLLHAIQAWQGFPNSAMLVPLKYLSYPHFYRGMVNFPTSVGKNLENINSHDMWKQRDLQGIWWSVSKHVSKALLAKSVTMFFFDAFGASVFERDGQSFIKSFTIGKLPAFAATCKVFLHGFRGNRDLGMYISQYGCWTENGGFSTQIIQFNRVFHYKSSILGTPIFGNIHI